MPSVSRAPIPTALFILPSSPSPASVTPRCMGYDMFSFSMLTESSRTDFTIITVFEALMLITTLWKSCLLKIRRNSMQLSTIPSGVSPYLDIIRSDKEPWLTPIRTAVLLRRQTSINGTSRSSIFCSSAAYSSSVYSMCRNFLAGSV